MKDQIDQFKVREVNLMYSPKKQLVDQKAICTSFEAHEYLRKAYNSNTVGCQEQFVVLLMNKGNKPLGVFKASIGGISSTVVDVRLVFAAALKSMSTGIIISHNHPSGSLNESIPDKLLTKKIKEGCRLMDIELIDHLILDPFGNYMSFADMGKL